MTIISSLHIRCPTTGRDTESIVSQARAHSNHPNFLENEEFHLSDRTRTLRSESDVCKIIYNTYIYIYIKLSMQ